MAQLRNKKIQDIYNEIQKKNLFSVNDFKIEFPKIGNELVKITFRGNKQYSFKINETTKEEDETNDSPFGDLYSKKTITKIRTIFTTTETPGNNKKVETNEYEYLESCIHQISTWIYNLDDELKDESTIENQVVIEIDKFEEKLNQHISSDSEKFTREDQEKLIKQLNELERRIKKLEETAIKEEQLKIIVLSKNELKTYPKKSWWIKFYNRVTNVNNGLILVNNLRDNVSKFLDNFGSI